MAVGSESAGSAAAPFHAIACLAIVLGTLIGCHTPSIRATGLPTRHSIEADQLLMLSNFKLERDHPLVQDLIELRTRVTTELELPANSQQVVVYLFETEDEYRSYLERTYPGLPPRRAYFVGTSHELAVYTYWGDRIREDLRHEYTHGLLHACLMDVPLWLDEGIAEYYEVVGSDGHNHEYSAQLATSISNGWRPDLPRLEKLNSVAQMQRVDYLESWAWVHFLLHSSPDSRQLLIDYLADLRQPPVTRQLNQRIQAEWPDVTTRLLNHIAGLASSLNWQPPG